MDLSQHSVNDHGHHTMPNDSHFYHHHNIVQPETMTPDVVIEDHHHTHASLSMDHMMMMYFHFGCNETILFSSWQTSSVPGLLVSMLIIFVMAILYEGLKYYREYLFWKTYNLLEYRPVSMPEKPSTSEENNKPPQPVHYVGEVVHKQPPTMMSWMHLYQTFLHFVQVTLSFLLMLIFMTYNVWLCLTVVFGAAVGYFLFCWKKSVIVDVTEHCH